MSRYKLMGFAVVCALLLIPVVSSIAAAQALHSGIYRPVFGVNGSGSIAPAPQTIDTVTGDILCTTDQIVKWDGEQWVCSSELADLKKEMAEVKELLANFSRTGDTVTLSGANFQVVNGTGSTDGDPNGLGNIIVGYNELRRSGPSANDRSGSHMLVVGRGHNYSRFGGVVVGFHNEASGDYASVCGGGFNTASGNYAQASGGEFNLASGAYSTVSGLRNTASGSRASVSGGFQNVASGNWSSVSGGASNIAAGSFASVSGGASNIAAGMHTSISGGASNGASGDASSVSGGFENGAIGEWSSVSGGYSNGAAGTYASVSGGFDNMASGAWSSVSGGKRRSVIEPYNWRAGDLFRQD